MISKWLVCYRIYRNKETATTQMVCICRFWYTKEDKDAEIRKYILASKEGTNERKIKELQIMLAAIVQSLWCIEYKCIQFNWMINK